MNTLENQSVTKSETNIVTKTITIIVIALCGVAIYCLLGLSSIRGGDQVLQMLAGLFLAIMLISVLNWPAKK